MKIEINKISEDNESERIAKSISDVVDKAVEDFEKEEKSNIGDTENHTLKDLRQKLINYLYELNNYDLGDIELIKILFENNDI